MRHCIDTLVIAILSMIAAVIVIATMIALTWIFSKNPAYIPS